MVNTIRFITACNVERHEEWTQTSRVEDIIYHSGPDSSIHAWTRYLWELPWGEKVPGPYGSWWAPNDSNKFWRTKIDHDSSWWIRIRIQILVIDISCKLHLAHPVSLPTTKLPINKRQLQIDNSKLPILKCKFQIANIKLPISNCHFKISNFKFQMANCQMQIVNCKLLIANSNYKLQIANGWFEM